MLTVNLDFFFANKHTSFYNEIIFDTDTEEHGLINCNRLGKCSMLITMGTIT